MTNQSARTGSQDDAVRSDIVEFQQAIDKQVLTFEKYDSPDHPVVLAAERRIVELHNRTKQVEDALSAVEAEPAPEKRAPELADILENLPDLRPRSRAWTRRSLPSYSTRSVSRPGTTTWRRPCSCR